MSHNKKLPINVASRRGTYIHALKGLGFTRFSIIMIISISLNNIVFATSSIRQINFDNFTYQPQCWGNKVTVHNGKINNTKEVDGLYQKIDENLPDYFEVSKPIYADLDGDGEEEAIVRSDCNTGGTGQFDEAYLFKMIDRKPILISRIKGGDRGMGGLVSIKVQNKYIFVTRNKSTANCCAEYTITTQYYWNGKRLVKIEPAPKAATGT